MIPLAALPALNAGLNGLAAGLLLAGYGFIRTGRVAAHRATMLGATAVSAAFLTSYLVYHAQAGSTRFAGSGAIRTLYFAILLSHTVLAAVVPILVGITLWFAFRREFDRHRRIARWTWPIWMYVSVTGVVIYVMLYKI
jgi:putative membrane protein